MEQSPSEAALLQSVLEFPEFMEQEISWTCRKCPTPAPVLSQMNPIQASPLYFCNIYCYWCLRDTDGFFS